MIPKFGVYIRINLDTAANKPKDVSAKIFNTNGTEISHSTWEQKVIEKAFAEAATNKMPLVSLILKAVASPLVLTGPGIITAVVTVDGSEHLAGALNLIITNATASAPPVSQSLPAS